MKIYHYTDLNGLKGIIESGSLWATNFSFLICPDGTTCMQACHDAGTDIRMQINESATPEEGRLTVTAPGDQTDTWYRQLETELQALEITGLTEKIRQAMVIPGELLRALPAPARLLHVLREILEAFPLTAGAYEKNTAAALTDLLASAGFTPCQAEELRLHRIRWPAEPLS